MIRTTSTDIIRTLSELQHTGRRRGEIFEDFVESAFWTLESMPRQARSVIEGNGLQPDEGEAKEFFERLVQRYGKYWRQFRVALGHLIESTHDVDGGYTYHDALGTVFEEWDLGGEFRGQFFTPESLCQAMVQMTVESAAETVRRRTIDALLPHAPVLGMMQLMGAEVRDATLELLTKEHIAEIEIKPVRVYDPTCGSFRLPLAAASCMPRWMIDLTLVRFCGQDVDRLCYQMARCNEMLYWLNGTGIWLTVNDQESRKVTQASIALVPDTTASEVPAESDEHGQLILILD